MAMTSQYTQVIKYTTADELSWVLAQLQFYVPSGGQPTITNTVQNATQKRVTITFSVTNVIKPVL